MPNKSRNLFVLLLLLVLAVGVVPPALATDWISDEERRAILEKTQTLRLAPALDRLTAGERDALRHLLAVGEIFQQLYEDSRHPQAAVVQASLPGLDPGVAMLYRLSQGPIATTLDNRRLPIVSGVPPATPGRCLYPEGISAAEIEAFLERRPELRSEILDTRTVVRLASAKNLEGDLATLSAHPLIAGLQPGLTERLSALAAAIATRPADAPLELYAVPYSVAYAPQMLAAQQHLFKAAELVEADDLELARYLRNRGRDLVSNDYESGDAAWITGRFGHLNAQIGAYETYDDALFGVKAFHAVSLLVRDEAATTELRQSLGNLQDIEDALPYEPHKKVRSDVPVGVYEVIADFGQARGTNTATILPNDALTARRYGRTILMRRNIILHPELAAGASRRWRAVVVPELGDRLVPEAGFQRTLWHEIGHYVGPDRTGDGRPLEQALLSYSDTVEEMKADLVSLFANERFFAAGLIPESRLTAVRLSGILRTLQDNQPRREQAYQVMQLAQFNYFLAEGLLKVDAEGRLSVDFARYPQVATSLLREVMALQQEGDAAKAEAFFTRWNDWSALHETVARRLRDATEARFRIVRYAALGE